METTIQTLITACEWFPSHFLIFSENVYLPFLYYSHLGSAVLAFAVGVFIFLKDKKALPNRLLLSSVVFFILWILCDVVLWATEFPSYTIFFWSLINLFEPFVHFFAFYFVYAFLFKESFNINKLAWSVLPLVPIILLTPTRFAILGYYLGDCDRNAIEGIMVFYGYGVEILYTALIVLITVAFIKKTKDSFEWKKAVYLGIGVLAFLASFSLGNIVESFTNNWYLAQSGFFGVPIFATLLAYIVVRFKAFDIKLLSSQVFVVALWILTLSALFLRTIENVRVIIGVNLLLATVLGYLLVKSVKKEVELREETQKLAKNLEFANIRQLETMRFITHEVKGYLTDASAGFDAITSGSFGPVAPDIKDMSQEALARVQYGVNEVKNFLHVSDFKTGKVTYAMEKINLTELLVKSAEELKKRASDKKLTLTVDVPEGDACTILGDADYIVNHILKNLIDNAINYTPEGSVTVSLTHTDGKVLFSVKDSGVGLSDEDKAVLFTEGGRGKDSRTINVHSTGYGLFIAKKIVDAHNGRIWAESLGRGKGSTFFVEFPGV